MHGGIGLIGLNDMDLLRWQMIDVTTACQAVAHVIEAAIELVVATILKRDRHPKNRLYLCRIIDRWTRRANGRLLNTRPEPVKGPVRS